MARIPVKDPEFMEFIKGEVDKLNILLDQFPDVIALGDAEQAYEFMEAIRLILIQEYIVKKEGICYPLTDTEFVRTLGVRVPSKALRDSMDTLVRSSNGYQASKSR